ncbi:MAG: rhomboid family intramembrane serine protease [Bacteroidota bacterium]|nr:rhomboid family intramembrane serine protease [Bacteroidota bacterium]
MNILDNIKQTFKQGSSLIKLIYINASVFILLKLILILLLLFNISGDFILSYLAVPADLTQLLYRAWTPLTYMFLHEGFLHIFFNMFTLFWFGRIFLMFFSEKQLVGLYLIGGFLAALVYAVAFNLFPYYSSTLHQSLLLGASGSIMAIIVATAFRSPNMELQVLFLGSVKLKYIAVFFVLTSLFGITSSNGGGELAHLGGALAGYLFVVSLRQGKDLTKGLNRILDAIYNLFGPRKLRIKQNPNRRRSTVSDAEFNMNKARKIAEIDRILDKIKTSGYESLSTEEKKRLFDQGKKN